MVLSEVWEWGVIRDKNIKSCLAFVSSLMSSITTIISPEDDAVGGRFTMGTSDRLLKVYF